MRKGIVNKKQWAQVTLKFRKFYEVCKSYMKDFLKNIGPVNDQLTTCCL